MDNQNTSKPKPKVKYSRRALKFICAKLAIGMTLMEICDTYYGVLPYIPKEATSIHRWRRKYPELDKAYREAKEYQFLALQDKIIGLSRKEIPDTGDSKRDHAIMRQREFEARTLLQISGQLASKYVAEQKEDKLTINTQPTFQIVNYYAPDQQLGNSKPEEITVSDKDFNAILEAVESPPKKIPSLTKLLDETQE